MKVIIEGEASMSVHFVSSVPQIFNVLVPSTSTSYWFKQARCLGMTVKINMLYASLKEQQN